MKDKKKVSNMDLLRMLIRHWKTWVPMVGVLLYNAFVAYLVSLVFGGAAFLPAFVSSATSVFILLGIFILAIAVKKKVPKKEDKKPKSDDWMDEDDLEDWE